MLQYIRQTHHKQGVVYVNNRERVRAILHYEPVDRMPVVAFGYWRQTLQKWAKEGHITQEQCDGYGDNSPADQEIMAKLGFDFNWNCRLDARTELLPQFPREVLSREADGSVIERDPNGLIVRNKPGVVSISSEIGTTLTDREAWEEHYLPRLQWCAERIPTKAIADALATDAQRDIPLALYCGSLYGFVRNLMGVEELSYMEVDDEDLFAEIIDTCARICTIATRHLLASGVQFDYAHYWEDICFKNGPLVKPSTFARYVGPHYKRMTQEINAHGIDIVSLDCDGCIDLLLPIWLENGVNTMFPIEVGTWNASIAPWRAQYGRALRGVGGMDKRVFAQDKAAVDREIERLRPLVELGGYIPCPDHRIAPDAKFELVAYYCERFRHVFG